jgi:protein-tyrosine phosphatase
MLDEKEYDESNWEYKFPFYRKGILTKIQDYLYLGDHEVARNKKLLDVCNITNIISIGNKIELEKIYRYFPDKNYHLIEIEDNLNSKISEHFAECNQRIKSCIEKGESILVHCFAGISRSTTLILSHLIGNEKMSYYSAFYFLKKRRPFINPNMNFIDQLNICYKKE